jgi:hypothetical protein
MRLVERALCQSSGLSRPAANNSAMGTPAKQSRWCPISGSVALGSKKKPRPDKTTQTLRFCPAGRRTLIQNNSDLSQGPTLSISSRLMGGKPRLLANNLVGPWKGLACASNGISQGQVRFDASGGAPCSSPHGGGLIALVRRCARYCIRDGAHRSQVRFPQDENVPPSGTRHCDY